MIIETTQTSDNELIVNALKAYINRHSPDEQNTPYLLVNGGKSYTLSELLTQIEGRTAVGLEMAQSIVALTVDLLARGREKLELPATGIPATEMPRSTDSGPVKAIAHLLASAIPVQWDRFTKTEDGFYIVYGWIPRGDGDRDFLMFEMWATRPMSEVFYTTSSAKYSRQIMTLLYGDEFEHNDCRKFEEL